LAISLTMRRITEVWTSTRYHGSVSCSLLGKPGYSVAADLLDGQLDA
jgi:hypothetical protein